MEFKTVNHCVVEHWVSYAKTTEIIITNIKNNDKIKIELNIENMIELKQYLEKEILTRLVSNV